MVWNLLTMLDILYKRICKPTGAYRGIEKEGGGEIWNAVTTTTRPAGPSLRRDGVPGEGMCPSPG